MEEENEDETGKTATPLSRHVHKLRKAGSSITILRFAASRVLPFARCGQALVGRVG